MNSKRIILLVSAGLALSPVVRAGEDVPLRNWTVPPYRVSSAGGGMGTMVDVSPGIGFVAVTPCRIVDTRGGGVFTGTYGPPALVGNAAARPVDINSAAHCPGIPAGADAYSLNFTLIAAAGVFQNAFLTAWPTGGAQPVVSTLNFNAGQLVANAAIVPAGTNGSINVFVNAPGHLLIDINGYLTDQYNAGVSFEASSLSIAPAILGENTSTVADAVAIQGVITSATPGASSAAVRGVNNGTAGSGIGVWGSQNGSGFGVYGTSPTGYGVYGLSQSGFGVVAETGGTGASAAVYARNTSSGVSSAVFGWANSDLARNYGIQGWSDSDHFGAAGVYGQDESGPTAGVNLIHPAGVHGESNNRWGVVGMTGPTGYGGVRGQIVGGPLGVLGYEFGATDYGVYSGGPALIGGNLTVNGTISTSKTTFTQPHPYDPGKQIRYVSLEGPHSEVYFRGTAQVSQGVTRIPIPEDFRLVASRDTYSTLVTPVGGMATVAVMSEGEDGIVIQASRNVRVHYVVYAEREAMKNPHPIIENVDFRPNPDGDPSGYPDSYRRLMIQNGTLNPDGTVNMETAKRLGWDKEWRKRDQPTPRPAE